MKPALALLFLFVSFAATAQERDITYGYPELGLTILTPGGFNLMAGYSLDDWTVRAMGMAEAKTLGFQAELNYNLGKTNFYKNGPGFVVGYMDYSDTSGSTKITTNGKGVRGVLVGGHYFWNWGLFYSSLGLAYTAINPNTTPPITVLFNIGVNHRFLHSGD